MQIKRRNNPVEINDQSLVESLYRARGLESEDYSIELSSLLPFDTLLNINDAANRLALALLWQQKILVIGDFDADGATASALAVSCLKAMGSNNVYFLVPNRFAYGYGLTIGIVEEAYLQKPDLIVTVDNGISNLEGVERARALGIDVIVTDHHLAGDVLPNANTIVNPNQPGDPFSSKAIAGVGVIFYVMCALRKTLEQQGWFEKRLMPNMAHFLDLVALGTVADVVPLDKNNRIMVKHGIQRIKSGRARPGIAALLAVCGKSATNLKASDLGFSIAPRLNAAGRLEDMSLGINCLLEENALQALNMARRLDELNKERRQIEADMQKEALDNLYALYGQLSNQLLLDGICLYQSDWHQGVIGIIASRIKDKFNRPTIIFAKASDTELKGSARSVEGLNIRDLFASIDLKNPGLIKKFGGHAMAAGLSISPDAFKAFKKAYEDELGLYEMTLDKTIWTDGELNKTQLNLQTVVLLDEAGPWGQGFPEPTFDNEFKIIEQRLVGQNHLKLTLELLNSSLQLEAIAFNIDLSIWPNHRVKYLHAVYQINKNEYQGRARLQLLILYMQPVTADRLQELEQLELAFANVF